MSNRVVKIWQEDVIIPTYPVGEPNKNPMFLEKRVYQGSSGKVYPHHVIDKICDEKEDKHYEAVFLENEYLKVMILPELGGRIHRATDKSNDYDFVYYNHVIKPALVGLTGPWISGGIEFNWPQHHRPSTFDPVSYKMEENKDGSCTVWVSEVENMFRTKGTVGFTLHPDKAYIEIKAQIYNRTNVQQTFLWWANPAVPVNDNTQSIFPPDVFAVMDHGKRDVSNFPIATGTYYKMDYSAGVDISRYKNIPVPTSYMAYHSDYDFVGGYDYQKEAGVLHVADHHVSPGKKQWTWGCGEFGQAWDRNLTDDDGPYIELMTGCFTDNQPDFTWLAPYEEKVFTQYFMPYKKVGMVKNATIDATLGLDLDEQNAKITVYVTSVRDAVKIIAKAKDKVLLEETVSITPKAAWQKAIKLPNGVKETDVKIEVISQEGQELVSYQAKEKKIEKIPDPARESPLPQEVKTTEDLYLYGQHLEQYRHATYEPLDYYKEGLRRDDGDYRLNNACGSLLFRRGLFKESEGYFRKAVQKLTQTNPNPRDGEPYYNLGLSLKFQGRLKEAYDAFFKATWNGAWQDSGFYQLACIDCSMKDYSLALEHIERCIVRNYHNMKARNLKSAILRHCNKIEECEKWNTETATIDVLDFNLKVEFMLLAKANNNSKEAQLHSEELATLLNNNHNTYLELAIDYLEAGLTEEAMTVCESFIGRNESAKVYPMIYYYYAFCLHILGKDAQAKENIKKGEQACSDYCFPHRLEDIIILEKAAELETKTGMAKYYLGNLWYDKKQYKFAQTAWEACIELEPKFPTAYRNLALAYYNKEHDGEKAKKFLEKAYELDSKDSRVLMELDQLYKKTEMPVKQRLKYLEQHIEEVEDRDDLYVEYIKLLNITGQYKLALEKTQTRNFHPWEGGEGKITKQYVSSLIGLAEEYSTKGEHQKAVTLLVQASGSYPYNLGEGKLVNATENDVYYHLGLEYEAIGDSESSKRCLQKATEGISTPAGAMYYYDQPPELIYYQGLSFKDLGEHTQAKSRFNKLISYGETHIFDDVYIDYFAVSLPDLMIFDDNMNRKNRIHCLFMMGLGHLGLGDKSKADEYFAEVLAIEPDHQGVIIHMQKKHK